MKVCPHGYLEYDPHIYDVPEGADLQKLLEEAVANEIAIMLKQKEKNKTAEDDYDEILFI